jgi:hypothetical protein
MKIILHVSENLQLKDMLSDEWDEFVDMITKIGEKERGIEISLNCSLLHNEISSQTIGIA